MTKEVNGFYCHFCNCVYYVEKIADRYSVVNTNPTIVPTIPAHVMINRTRVYKYTLRYDTLHYYEDGSFDIDLLKRHEIDPTDQKYSEYCKIIDKERVKRELMK